MDDHYTQLPGYKTGDGCSAFTYKYGVLEVIKLLNPAFMLWENVIDVAHCTKDVNGGKRDPAVKANSEPKKKIGYYIHRHRAMLIMVLYITFVVS